MSTIGGRTSIWPPAAPLELQRASVSLFHGASDFLSDALMIEIDFKTRLARLLRGERRVEDLDRIFLYLRDRSKGRDSIREIGDFVAHRDQREKGPVTQKARDIFTSARIWFRTSVQQIFEREDIGKAAEANLRTATPEQLMRNLGLKRDVAKSVIRQALSKLDKDKAITPRERKVVNYLGGSFIWNPAFSDDSVFEDLSFVLHEQGFVTKADLSNLELAKSFIALYIVAIMHGSAVVLDNGDRAELFVSFGNKDGNLEIKALLTIRDLPKPLMVPTCIFWTTLKATEHCSESIRTASEGPGPIEVGLDGKLCSLI